MFCPNCGKPLPDDAAFCEACGTKIEEDRTPARDQVQQPGPNSPKLKEGFEKILQLAKKNKKITGIGAGVILLAAALAVFILTRPVTIHPGDYLTVNFEGYNTIGEASFQLDEEAFYQDYAGKIEIQKEIPFGNLISDEEICDTFFQDCVSGSLNSASGLSNGDEVTFTWNCDDIAAEENYGVRLVYEDLTFTVEGLEEAQTVDPFADIELAFTGVAPYGEAAVVSTSEDMDTYYLEYDIEPFEGLRNGDTVTVSLPQAASPEDKDYYLRTYGVIFEETQKEYTVTGLGEYASSLSQIDSEMLEKMKSRGEDALRAEAAQKLDDSATLDQVTYIGSYFLTAKDSDHRDQENNMLYLVYQVQSSGSFPEDNIRESFSYYYTVRFDNLVAEPDGSISADLGEYSVSEKRFQKEFGNHRLSFNGYEDLDSVFRECVTKQIDRYSYESSVGTSQANTTQEGV